jgi:5-methyltetrahydropteroyltriglutamate--homocysteine methyltransferase
VIFGVTFGDVANEVEFAEGERPSAAQLTGRVGRGEIRYVAVIVAEFEFGILDNKTLDTLDEAPPIRPAAKLPVCHDLQTRRFLQRNDIADATILGLCEIFIVDALGVTVLEGLAQLGRPQEAADVIGAKRGTAITSETQEHSPIIRYVVFFDWGIVGLLRLGYRCLGPRRIPTRGPLAAPTVGSRKALQNPISLGFKSATRTAARRRSSDAVARLFADRGYHGATTQAGVLAIRQAINGAIMVHNSIHAEHIGSFIRPAKLLDAVRAHKAGKLDDASLTQITNDSIREIVTFQESLGLPSVTDGEFRRRSWSAGFIDAVQGFELRDGKLGFRSESKVIGVAASPYAKSPLKRKSRIVADDFRFLKSVVRNGIPKVTIASPDVMHFFLGPAAFEKEIYKDREAYFAALTALYREEVTDLAEEGCTYLQLDDTALPCNCDSHVRADVAARGEKPDELNERYARLINESISNKPASMTIAIHLCRGNLKGAWMAEGGYDPIADALFNSVNADIYCLEYDSPRAGGFSPLRLVPKGKTVILGLLSSKTPQLESEDGLKRRIDEAARYIPIEQLGISPQCGFSSVGGGGQVVTQEDTRRKLELVMSVAKDVWGHA